MAFVCEAGDVWMSLVLTWWWLRKQWYWMTLVDLRFGLAGSLQCGIVLCE